MAEEREHSVRKVQIEKDTNEDVVERKRLPKNETVGPEQQGEASSDYSRPRRETSTPHDNQAEHTTPPCPPEIRDSPQTFRCWQEDIEGSEIKDFIYEPAHPFALQSRYFRPKDADCASWASPFNSKCPASFGERGTTATAGTFGQLVQLSDYLGAGNSGMFSASHYYAEHPYLVTQRARDLHRLSSEPFEQAQRQQHSTMFGLKFRNLDLLDDAPPRLKWFQYRWPRYEYRKRCFKDMKNVGLTIQFIVRNRTVFQQCILENRGKTDVDIELSFCKGISISDLDHVTDDYEFNTVRSDDQNAGPGPGGFGWVHVNRFPEVSLGARTDSQHSTHEIKSKSNHDNQNKKEEQNHGVALVVSMAVNGEVVRFNPGQAPDIWKQTLKAKSSTPGSRSQKLEIVTAYKLVLLASPLSDWKTFVVPLKEMSPSKFLREAEAIPAFRTSITRISGNVDLTHTYDNQRSDTLEEGQAGLVDVSQDGTSAAVSKPQTEPSPAVDHGVTIVNTSRTMDHIEFTARRNLEHILGVCAIPVAVSVSEENAEGSVWEKVRDVQPIALTCGDMSGHRICTSSTFFAFQFLTEVAKRLRRLAQPDKDDICVQTLLSRIRDVCLGHIKWLYAAEKINQEEAFRSLYWVSGEAITLPDSSATWVPIDHVRDTAFQILKVTEFSNAFDDNEYGELSLVGEIISQWGQGWVRWLERSDRRESLTWYHNEDEGLKVFRLDDHVWIWRALKAMECEKLRTWAALRDKAQRDDRSSSKSSEASNAVEILRRSRKFASRSFQREVLLKFTTENEVLGRKMVALARSPRETRFLLHARDTALFHGQDMGFFPEDELFRDSWKNTIDSQRLHENNQESRWDNALRYALSLMLGIRGHQINDRKPGPSVRAATDVLLRSSSENGLFPGKLDIATKLALEDVFRVEKDADSYYQAGFEIPYVFLIYAETIGAIVDSGAEPELERGSGQVNLRHRSTGRSFNPAEAVPPQHTSNPQAQVDQREDREMRQLLAKMTDVLSSISHLPISTSNSDYTRSRELVVDARPALKKAIPFSNIIDSHSIVELEDEWLFNFPDFFGSKWDDDISIDDTLDSLQDLEATWHTSIDVAEMRRKYSPISNEFTSGYYHSTASSSSITTESSISLGGPGDSGLWVEDMPSGKHVQGKRIDDRAVKHLGSLEYIWEQICRPRTVANAKKRVIIWSGQRTGLGPEAALLCYTISKGDERANMLDFFERHFKHENFMFDHCNLAYNTWETEVHLSFFILGDSPGPLLGDAAHHVEGLPGVQGKHISRGSIGFRFHGDAFDRYWTVHQFANLDLKAGLAKEGEAFARLLSMNDGFLYQRKVLELLFFSNILNHVVSNTEEILAEVTSELGIKSGAFSWSIPSMDTYSSWSILWEGFAPLLQALSDDLTSAQDIISQWEGREAGRGQERPRWTLNDERKYRAPITRGQRVLNLRKKAIQDLRDDLESLQEACTTRLANAREELSFRSSQNIASFTYVTIVFLPLGFAASVFSMNGYPDAGWVASMVVIAVVALTITATALANAKLLLGIAEQFSQDARRLTGTVFQSSLIGQQQKQRDEQVQASTELNKSSHGEKKGGDPRQSRTARHVLFWMAYLLIELPARRVALACRALPASLIQSLGLLRPHSPPPSEVDSIGRHSGEPTAAVGGKIIRVAGGLLILPLLLISWTLQLLFYNVIDILTLLSRLTRKTFYALVAPSDAHGTAGDTKMVTWLIDPPSSLRPVRKLMSRDEKGEKPPPQADTPAPADRSDSGSHEQV